MISVLTDRYYSRAMDSSPQCPLDAVVRTYAPRLDHAAADPGLGAALDQHAAAIRDALGDFRRGELADYVVGFTDVLADMGWHEPEGYDFAVLRLTAVCRMAVERGWLVA